MSPDFPRRVMVRMANLAPEERRYLERKVPTAHGNPVVFLLEPSHTLEVLSRMVEKRLRKEQS